MSEVDISALRMKEAAPRKPVGPRIALIVLVLVLLGVAASFLIPLLTPPREVATVAAQIAGADGQTRVTTAEAAGWVEPDPYAFIARPLVGGVLEDLQVLEGHPVERGKTVIGRLRSAELEAARDRAQAKLALEEGNLRAHEANLKVAEELLEQRADLRLAETRARNGMKAAVAQLEALRSAHGVALAERAARAADYEGQRKLEAAGGSYPVALAHAKAELDAAEARVKRTLREIEAADAKRVEYEHTLAIAEEVLKDPRALAGEVTKARANVAHRRAARDAARVELAIATRELEWATVRAPATGLVMKLLAAPGDTVGPGGKGLVAIYDPKKLQARIDVPLASMGAVRVGQDVEIRSEVLGSRKTKGKVLRIQRESDMLKNTMQVKVQLIDPDPLLRPETLCRARFLASKGEETNAPALFRIPRAAVRDGAVFLLDPEAGRARRVAVEQVGEENGAVVVRGDLSVAHKIILDEVADGERVKEKP